MGGEGERERREGRGRGRKRFWSIEIQVSLHYSHWTKIVHAIHPTCVCLHAVCTSDGDVNSIAGGWTGGMEVWGRRVGMECDRAAVESYITVTSLTVERDEQDLLGYCWFLAACYARECACVRTKITNNSLSTRFLATGEHMWKAWPDPNVKGKR